MGSVIEVDSKTDAAYQTLRQEILTAHLAAGQALRPQALKDAYGLSWTPVREALARLEAERLVVYKRNHGFSVAPVSSAELDDLMRARRSIELSLLKESMELGDADWEASVVAAHHRLMRCKLPVDDPTEETLLQWETMHEAFHMSLLQAAVSQWLLRFQSQIYEQLRRHYRVLTILPALRNAGPSNVRARAAMRDAMGPQHHSVLMQAVLDRDVDQAVSLMLEHAGTTADVFAQSQAVPPLGATAHAFEQTNSSRHQRKTLVVDASSTEARKKTTSQRRSV